MSRRCRSGSMQGDERPRAAHRRGDRREPRRARRARLRADPLRHDGARPGRPGARRGGAAGPPRASGCAAAGADVDVWEPRPEDVRGRQVPFELDFDGRPQLVARFAGAGGGRSLLLNGHIDVVSGEPKARWTDDPNTPVVRDGKLYGRGSCDMKGGVAAMVLAAEMLARLGVRLAGDLIVNTITDEESTGAGGIASRRPRRARRRRASCRSRPRSRSGSRAAARSTRRSRSRAGRATPSCGSRTGATAAPSTRSRRRRSCSTRSRGLREEWRTRADLQHPYLSPPDIVPTLMRAGEWSVTYPAVVRDHERRALPARAGRRGRLRLARRAAT